MRYVRGALVSCRVKFFKAKLREIRMDNVFHSSIMVFLCYVWLILVDSYWRKKSGQNSINRKSYANDLRKKSKKRVLYLRLS